MQWREGIEIRAEDMHKDFLKRNPAGGVEDRNGNGMSCVNSTGAKVTLSRDEYSVLSSIRTDILREWGYDMEDEDDAEAADVYQQRRGLSRPLPAAFEKAFAPVLRSPNLIAFMVWTGVKPAKDQVAERQRQREEDERIWRERMQNFVALSELAQNVYDQSQKPAHIASAQIIAHFTYLSLRMALKGADTLKPLTHFGLKWLTKNPRPKPRHGQDLHVVLNSGKVVIEGIIGTGFGIDSLELSLTNNSQEDLEVTVQRGTIFQHINWEHRQNLMVAVDYVIPLGVGARVNKKMMAYCMNLSCACSSGNSMNLTDFYFDNSVALESQGSIWDHFESCFRKDD